MDSLPYHMSPFGPTPATSWAPCYAKGTHISAPHFSLIVLNLACKNGLQKPGRGMQSSSAYGRTRFKLDGQPWHLSGTEAAATWFSKKTGMPFLIPGIG